MIRLIYNLLWPIGLLLFLPRYLLKMFRRGGYRRKFSQRFGIYDRRVRDRLSRRQSIWLHAVSVGEVAIALKLARTILQLKPAARFALTTTTTTGFAFAEKNASPEIEVMYTPLDFWPLMRRAFRVVQPARIVLVEAEVWPNLVAEARKRNVPVALVNARLSPRSRARFQRFRWMVAPMFRLLDMICVVEPTDVDAWADLGVARTRIRHTGSIKYDPGKADPQQQKPPSVLVSRINRPVLFGGSTHRGEEEILARIYLRLREEFPQLLLFLAPRHVERVREVKKELERLSLTVDLCSAAETKSNGQADCLVLDRTGELRGWYPLASVVFVGKSLTAAGGQNPVEPILAGKPVVFGPKMSNFATLARELLSSDGAIEVSDEHSLYDAVRNLLSDESSRLRLVESAQRVVDVHRGATLRTAELVLGLTKQS